jgi:hypothetical protein
VSLREGRAALFATTASPTYSSSAPPPPSPAAAAVGTRPIIARFPLACSPLTLPPLTHSPRPSPRRAQAEKTLKSASGFLGNLFGGGSDKIEDAAEKFSRAGNSFKAAKKCAWG